MATTDCISVTSTGPTWLQLSQKLRDRCNIHARSSNRTFAYKVVKQSDGMFKPHTFCPVSATCSHMSEVLSAITPFGTSLSHTLYLSSFAPSTVNGQFCFGHINVPEYDWDHRRQKHFHITLETEINDNQFQQPILKEKARLNCFAEKQRFIRGPDKDNFFGLCKNLLAKRPHGSQPSMRVSHLPNKILLDSCRKN